MLPAAYSKTVLTNVKVYSGLRELDLCDPSSKGGMVVSSTLLHHVALSHVNVSLMQNANHARTRYSRLRLWAWPRHTIGGLAACSPRPFPRRDRVVGVMPLRTGPEVPAALRWMETRRSPTFLRGVCPVPEDPVICCWAWVDKQHLQCA